ncbi:B9 domain-containing protein 2 [Dermatophagoides pteronyssinus]|uniref:B9 domain-containing protein 2 n=1 Tax=Dermatophagoides pteronyssinus TaxID=6956 RepID=A0A6P6YHN4_DERPT|nr:B9 domain-containing protein 2-like [Dermatophagoides pteronyssinus]
MAEVFLIGQITGGENFNENSLFCKWKLIIGSGWKILEGIAEGQTQIDCSTSSSSLNNFVCWSHPIDLHLVTKGIQGWPKLLIEVWHRNSFEQTSLISYGVVNIPSQPGFKQIRCHTWRPIGSIIDRLANIFNGESLHLTEEWLIYSHEQRFRLHTETMGIVCLDLNIVMKDFEKFGVETH